MKPTIGLDMRQFHQAANDLRATSSRTCVDFTNGQALKVSIEAVRNTMKANRQQIAHVLGAIGRQVSFQQIKRGKNKGKIRVKQGAYQAKENSLAALILAKRFKLTGEWGAKGETMEERVANYIASKVRSAGFIASGWIGARNALFSFVKGKPSGLKSTGDARQYGKPKGRAKPARFSLNSKIEAVIQNTALKGNESNPPAPGGDPMPTSVKGLQLALDVTARDMVKELARRLAPDLKKASAK